MDFHINEERHLSFFFFFPFGIYIPKTNNLAICHWTTITAECPYFSSIIETYLIIILFLSCINLFSKLLKLYSNVMWVTFRSCCKLQMMIYLFVITIFARDKNISVTEQREIQINFL